MCCFFFWLWHKKPSARNKSKSKCSHLFYWAIWGSLQSEHWLDPQPAQGLTVQMSNPHFFSCIIGITNLPFGCVRDKYVHLAYIATLQINTIVINSWSIWRPGMSTTDVMVNTCESFLSTYVPDHMAKYRTGQHTVATQLARGIQLK